MQLSGVRLSVCPISLPHAAAAGLLLRARRAGDIDRLLQQRQAKCGQCHVVSVCT